MLFLAACAAVVGLVLQRLRDKRKEDLETIATQRDADIATHKGTHALIEQRFTAVEHKAENQAQVLDSLGRRDEDKEVRLVKLELSLDTFKEEQARIEGAQAALRHDMNERLDDIVERIREIPVVAPQ